MHFAITGNPINHSLSPQLFLAAYNGRFQYDLLPAQTAEEAIRLFKSNRLKGMNVTAPFKRDMLAFVDECSEEVTATGALNTVVRQPDGTLKAYNTDCYGVEGSLQEAGVSLLNKTCIVLGAGGAGAAAVYALRRRGAVAYLLNRTVEKAQALALRLGVQALPLSALPDILPKATVVVSTLPPEAEAGTGGKLAVEHTVLDASYIGSSLKEQAQQAGCIYMDGRYWLLHQGVVAYKLFTELEPDVKAMHSVLNLS